MKEAPKSKKFSKITGENDKILGFWISLRLLIQLPIFLREGNFGKTPYMYVLQDHSSGNLACSHQMLRSLLQNDTVKTNTNQPSRDRDHIFVKVWFGCSLVASVLELLSCGV